MRRLFVALLALSSCSTQTKVVPAKYGSTVSGEVQDSYQQIREYPSQRIVMYLDGELPGGGASRFQIKSPEKITLDDSFVSIATQLRSALIQNPNVKMLDEVNLDRALARESRNKQDIFRISVLPTEYAENIDESESGSGSLGRKILLAPWRYVEFWINIFTGLPTKFYTVKRNGVVAFDVSIVDSRSRRILDSFPARGTFTSKERKIGSMMSYNSSSFAGGTFLQASRAAVGEATIRILKTINQREE